jgi:hypothetical protein
VLLLLDVLLPFFANFLEVALEAAGFLAEVIVLITFFLLLS